MPTRQRSVKFADGTATPSRAAPPRRGRRPGQGGRAVDDGVVDRLQREPVAYLGHVRPRLGGVVVDQVEHPTQRPRPPDMVPSVPHRRSARVDDAFPRALSRRRPAPCGARALPALKRRTLFRDHDLVLAAQPRADLAIAYPQRRA